MDEKIGFIDQLINDLHDVAARVRIVGYVTLSEDIRAAARRLENIREKQEALKA